MWDEGLLSSTRPTGDPPVSCRKIYTPSFTFALNISHIYTLHTLSFIRTFRKSLVGRVCPYRLQDCKTLSSIDTLIFIYTLASLSFCHSLQWGLVMAHCSSAVKIQRLFVKQKHGVNTQDGELCIQLYLIVIQYLLEEISPYKVSLPPPYPTLSINSHPFYQ